MVPPALTWVTTGGEKPGNLAARTKADAPAMSENPVLTQPVVPIEPADTSCDDVVLVDDRDVAIGTMPKLRAHELGARHRALSVLVHDRQNRLLLHRRAEAKYHSGGLWTNTCCSHPRPGEEVQAAASRRLQEEMGIACALHPLFRMQYRVQVSDRLIESEFLHVFGGCHEGPPSPHPDEVSDWRWVSLPDIAADVERHPQHYTAWFQLFRRDHWQAIVDDAARDYAAP